MTEQQNYLTPGNTPANLPNATGVLVLGILSILLAFCYGFFGVVCGIIGLVLSNKDRRLYQATPELYSPASYGTLTAGRTCSIIGLIIGSLFLLIIIFYMIFFGAFIMEGLRQSSF
ncbi:MAG: hypothetical protein KF825_05440 [Ferruginibacter sp.]|nr:hypothetical protein [Ferruginibacter sp.]